MVRVKKSVWGKVKAKSIHFAFTLTLTGILTFTFSRSTLHFTFCQLALHFKRADCSLSMAKL